MSNFFSNTPESDDIPLLNFAGVHVSPREIIDATILLLPNKSLDMTGVSLFYKKSSSSAS
jgi:hypothetical protein